MLPRTRLGAVNLFADMAAEGARGIVGLYLAGLGASGLVVGAVSGFGELLATALPFVLGRWAGSGRLVWPIARAGAVVQMAAAPALALVGTWPHAAFLVLAERAGRATRSPTARSWAGAVIGPLAVAAILFVWRDAHPAFGALAVPGLVMLVLVFSSRATGPDAGPDAAVAETGADGNYPPAFWWYLGAASFVAFGFADYSLISYHDAKAVIVPHPWIPVFYAVAMGAGGLGSLAVGRLVDRRGLWVLVPLTAVVAAYAPLAFSGEVAPALAGAILWGIGLGAHGSVMPAAVARMVPGKRLGPAYGLFGAVVGVAWFLGSAVLGALYDVSIVACAGVAAAAQLLAVPPLVIAARRARRYT